MLVAGCPRCPSPVTEWQGTWACGAHGPTAPLWRPHEVTYDAFAEQLRRTPAFPTYLPWPLGPGWQVSDFALVGADEASTAATLTCASGLSALDGPVEVLVVAEEPGVGLGARCAGTTAPDPGGQVGRGTPDVRVRIGTQAVPLWTVSTSGDDERFDRSVLAGEALGRWLWLVLRPASAILLLRDDWILRDVSGLGPPLVELPFGGERPTW
ncbi:hypothetical protein INN71_05580 [Nocardioides sp. ChNu-153]|uniref:DUF6758 family protein n=1 Tax=unclassified Nocardioides TaxID=2615069 RepID=UPI0024049DC1|nr:MULTISPECIES: DUF6758 family protein [unclassified Nocardioides]MDF9717438.1 hypothetical protein [Nocardioides sp. ChNu-99]MDN7120856.1 hypothetical protein [Nocardioides sp. ChNu-153]